MKNKKSIILLTALLFVTIAQASQTSSSSSSQLDESEHDINAVGYIAASQNFPLKGGGAGLPPDIINIVSDYLEFNSKKYREIQSFHGLQNPIVALSLDKRMMVIGSGHFIYILQPDVKGIWKLKTTLSGNTFQVSSIALSPDKKMIVAASNDLLRPIKVWQADAPANWNNHREPIAILSDILRSGHRSSVTSLAVSSDNKMIVSGSLDKTIKIWQPNVQGNWSNGQEPTATLSGHNGRVTSVALSPDKKIIVSASYPEMDISNPKTDVKIWKADAQGNWNNQQEAAATLTTPWTGLLQSVTSLALSPDKMMIVAGNRYGQINIWQSDAQGNWDNQWKSIAKLQSHTKDVTSIALSSDKMMIVSGSNDKTIKIWQPDAQGNWNNQEEAATTLSGHAGKVISVALSPDKKMIVSADDSGFVKIWLEEQMALMTEIGKLLEKKAQEQ